MTSLTGPPGPETPLSDAGHALWEARRKAESLAMDPDPVVQSCGRQFLAVLGDTRGLETAGTGPLAGLKSRLADADNAIGQVLRHAWSWRMQGGLLDVEHVARVLLDELGPWTGAGHERTDEKERP